MVEVVALFVLFIVLETFKEKIETDLKDTP